MSALGPDRAVSNKPKNILILSDQFYQDVKNTTHQEF